MTHAIVRTCAGPGCEVKFVPHPHNQIYHNLDCCKAAIKEKANKKYYETKARKAGAQRVCRTPNCGTLLSRYNSKKVCSKCEQAAETQRNQSALEALGL